MPNVARPVAPLFRRKLVYAALVLAFLCLVSGAIGMWRGITAHKGWQNVDAQVRASDAVTFRPRGGSIRYRPQVEITYLVDGSAHIIPISIPEVAASREQLEELMMRYRPGVSLQILYDPRHPEDIDLQFADSSRLYVTPTLLLGLGLALLTYVFVMAARDGAYQCVSCGMGVAEKHAFCHACGTKIPRRKGKMAK
jgi:hypothetical protein